MKCPRDSHDLKRVMVEELEVDQCPTCSGLWLPAATLNELAERYQARIPKVDRLRIGQDFRRGSAIGCPEDRAGLFEYRFHGVVIDICADCGGVWLDGGELQSILKKIAMRNEVKDSAAEVANHGAEVLFEVGEIPIKVLKELVEAIASAF